MPRTYPDDAYGPCDDCARAPGTERVFFGEDEQIIVNVCGSCAEYLQDDGWIWQKGESNA